MAAVHRVALLAGVILTLAWPTLAFSDASSGTRAFTADVVTDANGYAGLTQVTASLTLLNSYTANSFTITHKHVTGTTMSIAATITGGPGAARIVLTSGSGSIGAPGGSITFQVRDTAVIHTACDCDVTVQIDTNLFRPGVPAPVSTSSYTRTMDVNV